MNTEPPAKSDGQFRHVLDLASAERRTLSLILLPLILLPQILPFPSIACTWTRHPGSKNDVTILNSIAHLTSAALGYSTAEQLT